MRKPGLAGIIRRNLRNASMQCLNDRCLRPKGVFQNVAMALKASRKPIKLRGLARVPIPGPTFQQRPDDASPPRSNQTRICH